MLCVLTRIVTKKFYEAGPQYPFTSKVLARSASCLSGEIFRAVGGEDKIFIEQGPALAAELPGSARHRPIAAKHAANSFEGLMDRLAAFTLVIDL
jgi:hypothetical protein